MTLLKRLFRKHTDYENWYFETSSVNYLLDNVFSSPKHSSIKTRKLQLNKSRKWYISNITLWEIFLTNNEDRRRELFDFSRCLFYKKLMPSIEELLINYIQNGLPIIETRYELKSNSIFSKHWEKSCKNRSYFFEPDHKDLKRHTEYYRFLGEYFVKTNNGYILNFEESIFVGDKELELKQIENSFKKLISDLSEKEFKELEQYIHLSFKLVLIIFCYGINFNQKLTENYWSEIGIENLNDRIEYLVENMPDIFYRGPISNITKMILSQANTKSTRGVYFDALHSIYITYSDLYFSDDEHFNNLKTSKDPNMIKIKKVSESI
ncbi:conserved hypothetical protein [Tenacibaculum maritimum]|uniref:hypothetical protein n=1 Tax=Tenacibaculum maritimum TaxID=107401 RepID=UPI0012E5218A|nr:hypothetical protein [Tenacibaculum maritimum]CAA0144317.1 conserved hypothetical protein [Tenacibaculum maritimum]CAA0166803.1 conserved hypothetical protein [Tenacibaculum maritimum]CAA0170572.1 conserved hypothetical protein [Tenacibaculum maritimum]